MKHTPGPWEAVRLNPVDGDSFFIEEMNQRGIVAEVVHICTEEWTESNARLIEAAPDLLDALKELQKRIHAYVKMNVKKHYSLLVADAAASKAIHKAEIK